MPNTPQTKATLMVDKTTGAISGPVSAATFKTANSLGGASGAPEAHAASHASAGSDAVTLAESQVTGLAAALAAKAAAADLTSHTGNTSNPHSVTKAQVGLTNADNTSDAAKPVSTAAQTALDLKASAADLSSHTGNVSNPHSVTKAQVGLANTDNTSDAAKPVSTATQTALDLKQPLATVLTNTTAAFTSAQETKLAGVETGAQANVALASQAEAEAGSESTKTMTPVRVAQAIAALGGGGGGTDYILIRDEKSQGTQGGTFTAGAWRTRDLNTEVSDAGGHASVASNQITLAAGTYRIRAIVPSYGVGYHKAKLYNITDSADVSGCMSTTSYGFTSGNTSTSYVFIEGRFTIAGTKVFEIQHRSELTVATFGFGSAANITGAVEVYTVAVLERES